MNLNALDLNLIRVFDALYRERSATRAGERIGLSQPAVSASLNRLRHILNDQLFVRVGNDMLPTPRAEELQSHVRQALAVLEGAFRNSGPFDPARLERTFTLMGADFFSTEVIPPLSGTLAGLAPGVRIRMLDSSRGDVSRLLQDDAIDIALERPLQVPEWVLSAPLFRSPFAVIASADEPAIVERGLAAGDVMPIELFCALPHALRSIDGGMTAFTDDALAMLGLKRRVVLAVPQFHPLALAVSRGGLISVVPCQFAEAAAARMPIMVLRPPVPITVPEIRMYWHARHDGEAEHRWLRQVIREEIDRLRFDDMATHHEPVRA